MDWHICALIALAVILIYHEEVQARTARRQKKRKRSIGAQVPLRDAEYAGAYEELCKSPKRMQELIRFSPEMFRRLLEEVEFIMYVPQAVILRVEHSANEVRAGAYHAIMENAQKAWTRYHTLRGREQLEFARKSPYLCFQYLHSAADRLVFILNRLAGGARYCEMRQLHKMSKAAMSREWQTRVPLLAAYLHTKYVIWPSAAARRTARREAFGEHTPFDGLVGMIDGTEFSIERPPPEEQQMFYSGSKKRHTVISQIICDVWGRIIYISPLASGSRTDKRMQRDDILPTKARYQARFFSPGEFLIGDGGYGATETLHTEVSFLREWTSEPGDGNGSMSLAARRSLRGRFVAFRQLIENVIGQVKMDYKIMHDVRFWGVGEKMRTDVWRLVCALYNLRRELSEKRKRPAAWYAEQMGKLDLYTYSEIH